MSMQNKEALLTRVGKRILNIDGITLESVNSLRKEDQEPPYPDKRGLRAVFFAAALANQVLPLMSADLTEAYRRGKML